MTQRKPHYIARLDDDSAEQLDENVDSLYEKKAESHMYYKGSASETIVKAYQSQQMGDGLFSATGSPTVTKTFPLPEKQVDVIYVTAHACTNLFTAHVTDVTQTSVSVTIQNKSGAGNISANSTEACRVFWQVIGSNQ